MKWTNKGHELDAVAKIICDDKNEYYIWGASNNGNYLYNIVRDKIKIIGYIDSDILKYNCKFNNLNVYSPDILKNKTSCKVIVAVDQWLEIKKDLLKKNFEEDKDFFKFDKFISIYMVYTFDKLYLNTMGIKITDICTLKCEKCNYFIPYYNNPEHMSFENFKNNIDLFFDWVDGLSNFTLVGGEVFTHSKLNEILEYILKNYIKKIRNIEIFTNATIIPNQDTIDVIKKLDVELKISDYSENVKNRQKIDEIANVLKKNNIRYKILHIENWEDIGFPANPLNITDENRLRKHFDDCNQTCNGIYDKKYYYCHMMDGAERTGLLKKNDKEKFDLEEEINDYNKKILLEFDMGYNEKGYLDFCKLCRGMNHTDPIFCEVAKQII